MSVAAQGINMVATHVIERGTDITMIQKLLGHKSIKTTLRYLHTSNKNIVKIVSTLDDLKLLYVVFAL
jgi:integrase/recombinase XerD